MTFFGSTAVRHYRRINGLDLRVTPRKDEPLRETLCRGLAMAQRQQVTIRLCLELGQQEIDYLLRPEDLLSSWIEQIEKELEQG